MPNPSANEIAELYRWHQTLVLWSLNGRFSHRSLENLTSKITEQASKISDLQQTITELENSNEEKVIRKEANLAQELRELKNDMESAENEKVKQELLKVYFSE